MSMATMQELDRHNIPIPAELLSAWVEDNGRFIADDIARRNAALRTLNDARGDYSSRIWSSTPSAHVPLAAVDAASVMESLGDLVSVLVQAIRVDITDDVLRKNEHQPMAYKVTGLLDELGLVPRATIYNHNPNFVYTMGPAMMKAMRTARLHCNGCKVVQVAATSAGRRRCRATGEEEVRP